MFCLLNLHRIVDDHTKFENAMEKCYLPSHVLRFRRIKLLCVNYFLNNKPPPICYQNIFACFNQFSSNYYEDMLHGVLTTKDSEKPVLDRIQQ